MEHGDLVTITLRNHKVAGIYNRTLSGHQAEVILDSGVLLVTDGAQVRPLQDDDGGAYLLGLMAAALSGVLSTLLVLWGLGWL